MRTLTAATYNGRLRLNSWLHSHNPSQGIKADLRGLNPLASFLPLLLSISPEYHLDWETA